MRIKLKEGKQKELILKAKNKMSWKKLASRIKLNAHYLSIELKNEERLISKDVYNHLCNLVKINYDNWIMEELNDNWGRSKGGKNSVEGNVKEFTSPKESDKLAEMFGIILGDGHVSYYQKGKKIRCYCIKIAGDLTKDKNYIGGYIKRIIKEIFEEKSRVYEYPKNNAVYITFHGKKMVEFIIEKGIKPGNKKINNQNIPLWIKQNDDYIRNCLRGLIDTDGSIHYISKNNKNLRICFTSYIPPLLNDVRDSLIILGFHPSKIIKGNQIFITRKEDIEKYFKEIGFSNEKHLKRIENFKNELL